MTSPNRLRPHLVRPAAKPKGPTYSEVKKAIRLFRGRGVDKATYRLNAKKWLAANAALGDRHILHREKPSVRWGQPGDVVRFDVLAPRRMEKV